MHAGEEDQDDAAPGRLAQTVCPGRCPDRCPGNSPDAAPFTWLVALGSAALETVERSRGLA